MGFKRLRSSQFLILVAALAVLAVSASMYSTARASQLFSTPWYQATKCSNYCASSPRHILTATSTATQNLQLRVMIPNCRLDVPWDPLGPYSLSLVPNPGLTATVEIPYIAGTSIELLGIDIPRIYKSCDVLVKIIDSRTILVFLNQQYVDGMRFNSPILRLGTWAIDEKANLRGSIRVQGLTGPSRSNWSWATLTILLAAVCMFIATITSFRLLQSIERERKPDGI